MSIRNQLILSIFILSFGCISTDKSNEIESISDQSAIKSLEIDTSSSIDTRKLEQQVTKQIGYISFTFPRDGFAFDKRDSLVEATIKAFEKNQKIIGAGELKEPYQIRFYPSKAAMKADKGSGVSGYVNFWNKEVNFVATDDPETIKKENTIPTPIVHEIMHVVSMEAWGYTPESNFWLNEGLATYSAKYCNGFGVPEIYRYMLSENKLLPMDSLVDDFYSNDEMIAYNQSAYYVHYLIQKFGIENLSELWKEGFTSFERIYGLPFSEMESAMNAEIVQKYPMRPDIDWEIFSKGCK